jgi:hypothetical protein
MSMSRSRATPTGDLKRNRGSRSVEAGRGPAQLATATAPRESEWKTERWKLQVEAEARSRLKKSIRHVGSER